MLNKSVPLDLIRISKEEGIPLKKLLDVLFLLHKGEAIDNNDLVKKVGVSKNMLNLVKDKLKIILRPPSKNTQIKGDFLKSVGEMFPADYLLEEKLFSFLENADYKNIIGLLTKHNNQRPAPVRNYDQFTATLETTARRACLLNFFEDLTGKRVLFLGDDDFTSVAIAYFKKTANITVLEIDPRIQKGIDFIARKENLRINTFAYDARIPLPGNLLDRFDVVFTDPPYCENGVKLFVSRAVEAMDSKSQSSRIYLCYGNSDRAKERFLPIQQIIYDSGLMARWVFDKFNRYEGIDSIGSSSLFIFDTTPKTKALINGKYDGKIYTNETY